LRGLHAALPGGERKTIATPPAPRTRRHDMAASRRVERARIITATTARSIESGVGCHAHGFAWACFALHAHVARPSRKPVTSPRAAGPPVAPKGRETIADGASRGNVAAIPARVAPAGAQESAPPIFRPSGANEPYSAAPVPRLAPWATLWRPSGAG